MDGTTFLYLNTNHCHANAVAVANERNIDVLLL